MATTAFDSSLSGSANAGTATYGSLERRLASVHITADRLQHRLRDIYRSCGLDRHHLVTIQRSLAGLERAGLAPTANEFWAATAQPRAHLLRTEATGTIARELDGLVRRNTKVVASRTGSADGPEEAFMSASLTASAALSAAIPGREEIDELGRWWQRRLRRVATVKSLSTLAGTAARDAELVVSRFEMGLLERTPWSHGDRLLSAFELAHAEVDHMAENGIAAVVDKLFTRPPTPGHHHLGC